jgi:hypothetical protein
MSSVLPLGAAIAAKSNEEKGEPIKETETRERRPLRDLGDSESIGLGNILSSTDYVRLNVSQMNELSRRYHNDPIIRIVAEAVRSRVFSGKVRIEKAGAREEKKVEKKDTDPLEEQYSQIWSSWGMQILEQQEMWGFAAATFVSDPIHGFVPRVLNLLDGIEIRYRVNKFNERLFAFYQRPMPSSGLGPTSLPLPNVYVFPDTPPGNRGEIRSKVASLGPVQEHLEMMTRFSLAAESRRCNPTVMTEHVEYNYKTEWNPADPSSYPRVTSEQERCMSFVDRLAKHANTFGVSSPGVLLNKADHMLALLTASGGSPTHHLDPGRRYVSPQMPEPPADIERLRLSYQQIVMMLWQMPPPVMQAESTHGKIGHNEDSRRMFDESIKTIKDRIAGYMADMYHIMWDKPNMEKEILSTPLHTPLTADSILRSTWITVSIPGRPAEPVYSGLYREGSLKWSAYRLYQSGMHSIPLESFEEEPKLSLIDLMTEGQSSIETQKGEIAIANREREIQVEGKEERKNPAKKKAKK